MKEHYKLYRYPVVKNSLLQISLLQNILHKIKLDQGNFAYSNNKFEI